MGEMTGITPPCMDWKSQDPPTSFQNFKQYCELIFKGPLAKKSDEEKCNYTLLWLGQEGIRVYKSWGKEFKKPDEIFEAFSKHFEPKSNFRINRFNLQKFRQDQHETVDDFVARCKLQARKCKFTDAEMEERLIEQLIIGTKHVKVQERLLGKDETLKLDAALDTARTHEATENHMSMIKAIGNHRMNVDTVRKKTHTDGKWQSKCQNCGRTHPSKKCPAYGTTCRGCGGQNHWQKWCKKSSQEKKAISGNSYQRKPHREKSEMGPKKHQRRHPQKHAHEVQQDDDGDQQDEVETCRFETISIISIDYIEQNEVFADIDIMLHPNKPAILKMKVDTGAQGNLLPMRLYRLMYPDRVGEDGRPLAGMLKKTKTIVTGYGKKVIPLFGIHTITCKRGDKKIDAPFYVVGADGPALGGLPLSLKLGLVSMNCEVKESPEETIVDKQQLKEIYPDRFQGIGQFSGEYHIVIDKDVPPVIHPARRCPINIKDEIKHELDEMEKLNVIEPVLEPTDWVSSLVYAQKPNGRWRVCLDPKDLNKAIKRAHTSTPTLEEIKHRFAGATVFSTLDAKHGYWSIKLDEESSKLTTFNSPFGRYKFKRLPFGLSVSQDIFQQKMNQILEKCTGVIGLADDVAVVGATAEEHDRNLHCLMRVAREHGLIFNWEKCRIKQDQVRFFGLVFDRNGVHPDPQKTTAIDAITAPTSVKELQEFLGIVTYMSPFIPNLATQTAPLRELMKKDVIFAWTASHQQAFESIKKLITAEVTLAYFNPKEEVVIEVDASSRGLGAALTQKGKPIAFASKSLTDTERRYANIEREMLAVIFACEKFHTFVYGKPFKVLSDHKPLGMIHLKNLGAAPPRLQRMLLRLQGYDVVIKYKPGREMLLSDAMSRLNPLPGKTIETPVRIDHVMFSEQKIQQVRDATAQDDELCALRDVILQGWPGDRHDVARPLRKYWAYRDELSIEDGVLLKGSRVFIPRALTKEFLDKIHEAHQGIVKSQLLAKTCIYWHGINSDIEDAVKSCPICQEFGQSQTPESLRPHEIPTRPWQVIATDLFNLDGKEYLLIADIYSKYPIVRKIQGHATSACIIDTLKEVFSEQGTPEKVMSDNGPQYSSSQFKSFADEWNFTHVTSSPRYPQSNGFIERQVRTIKMTIMKAKRAKQDISKALQYLRATPVDHHLPSPAEMLLGRKIQSGLPIKIRNQDPNRDAVKERLQERQDQQKFYYDRNTRPLPPLYQGQQVRVQDQESRHWEKGTILNKRPEPRSYEVLTSSGQTLRRTRRHIRETGEKSKAQHESEQVIQQDDQDNTLDSHTHNSQSNNDKQTQNTYVTRSGRHVRRPKRFDP